jgi:hypothetical protein
MERPVEPGRDGALAQAYLAAIVESSDDAIIAKDRTRALLTGYQAHLAKPIESAELIATVASFAELVKSRR